MDKDKGVSLNMFVTLILFAVIIGVFGTLSILNAQITGAQSGIVNVNVPSTVNVVVVPGTSPIDCGPVSIGNSENTLDLLPGPNCDPFILRNDGNVVADIEVTKAAGPDYLFTSGGGDPASSFMFMVSEPDGTIADETPIAGAVAVGLGYCGANCDECDGTNCYNPIGMTEGGWINVPNPPAIGSVHINDLAWADANDEVRVDILMAVPSGEAPGPKDSTIIFSAS